MNNKGLQKTKEEISPLPLDLTENKAGRFISLSMMLHAALVAIVAVMSVPALNLPNKETIEFEVESETTAVHAIPDGNLVPETKGAATETPATEPAPAPVMALPAAAPVAKAIPKESSAPKIAAVTAAPATIDDISSPDLEVADTNPVAVAQMSDEDLQDDFDKVDRENTQALAAAKKSLDEDTETMAKANEEALKKAQQANQVKAKKLAEAAEARRQSDLAAIAAVEAKEKADAEQATKAAAKEAADREAAGAAEAAAREARIAREGEEANARLAALKEAHGKNGTGDSGEGTGDSGSPEPTKEVAGIPGGVRSLEQLRQMPGNKFPQYSSEERLARQEGQAMFYAYVNKDGSLSQFKLGKSTGFRNLDSKTLMALKKWKFYPGQEGWVEMPFQWALSGDAMEAGGQLRK